MVTFSRVDILVDSSWSSVIKLSEMSGKLVNDAIIVVIPDKDVDEAASCHVVFIGVRRHSTRRSSTRLCLVNIGFLLIHAIHESLKVGASKSKQYHTRKMGDGQFVEIEIFLYPDQ